MSSYLTGIVVASSHEDVTERTLTDGFPSAPDSTCQHATAQYKQAEKKMPSPDLDPSHVIA